MVRIYACVLVLLLSWMTATAAQTTDFSGSYTLNPAKHPSKSDKNVVETLTVVQTANAIEVTRVINGKSNTNKFPLDGGQEIYRIQNQAVETGTCKGHMKGNQLFLDATVTARSLKDGPPATIYFKERWQLSPDSKTLKIRREVESSLSPNGLDPLPDVYTRN
jgi:hypothetical protein